MKKIITLFLLFLMIGTFSTNAQTFSGDTGLIPDNACPTTTPYNVTVSGIGILGTTNILDEVEINITHTWNSDLDIFLVAPDATQITLSAGNGGSGDNYTNTIFRDDAATSITAGSAPFTGTFLPQTGSLASFGGVDADGVWSIAICDGAGGDTGSLDSFDITFAPAPVTPPNCDSTLTATTDVSISGDISWTAATGGPTAYDLTVGTSMGGSEVLATTDVGNVTTFNVGALAYSTTYYVTIVPKNTNGGSATGCTEQTFVTEADPFTEIDCAAGTPLNTTYCYSAFDTTQFAYRSSDGSNLRVTFNAGDIESCCDDLVILDSDGVTELFRGANGGDLTGLSFSSSGDSIIVAVDADGSVQPCAAGADWDWNVECLSCTPSVIASTTVIEDCANDLYDLEITFSNLGDAAFIVGTTAPFPFETILPGTLTYTLPGYAKGTPAEYSISHTSPVCDYNVGPFQDACPLENDTSAGALPALVGAFGACETLSYDTTLATHSGQFGSCEAFPGTEQDLWYSFTTNAVTGINIEVTSGTPGSVEFTIWDETGTTEILCDSGLATGVNSYFGLTPSTNYLLQVWNETFNDGPYTLCISDIECVPATVDTATVNNLCGTSQYEVSVVLTDVADATGVSDGVTTYPFSGTTAVAGPFTAGTPVNLTVVHGATTSCNIDLGSFIDTCPVVVDCAGSGIVSDGFCYVDNDLFSLGYASSDDSALSITFTAGTLEESTFSGNTFDDLIIYDGSDNTGSVLYNSNDGIVGNSDLTGLSFTATSGNIFLTFDADGSNDCGGGDQTPVAFDVECLACSPAIISSSTVVTDCNEVGGTDTFRVDIVVTDVGSASQITDGTNVIDITGGPGTYSTIDYAFGTSVTLDVDNTDPSCELSLGSFGLDVCPPVNDECLDAIALTVNPDFACGAVTSATIEGATGSGESDTTCGGTENDDVWFTFTATAETHRISLINITGGTTDLYHSLWEGTCGSLTNILCSDPNTSNPEGLTIGTEYTVRVNSWTATPGQTSAFDICIGTPPPPPANDECLDAIALTVNPDFECGTVTPGTIASATASGESDATCGGTENDDVWFKFTATATEHTIDIINITGGTTDLYHSLWEGACGSLTNILCSDPNNSTATGLTIGTEYTLRVNSWTGTPGQTSSFEVCIGTAPPPPANDTCATAIAASIGAFGACETTTFTNESASYSGVIGSCEGFAGADEQDVWYTVATDAVSTAINIEVTSGTPGNLEIALYDACGGTQVFCDSGLTTGLNAITGLTPSTTYLLQIWTETFSSGSYDICLSYPPLCTPADITSSTVVDNCGAGTFTVDVLVADVGSAGSVIDDGTTTYPLVAGTVTVGPYPVSEFVTLNIVALDSNCDAGLGTFSTGCPPVNDDFANAIPIACGDTIIGDTSAATLDEDDAPDTSTVNINTPTDTDSPNIWYSFFGTGQDVTLDTCLDGTDFDTEIIVFTGTSGNLTNIAEGYDECTGTNSDFLAQVTFTAEAGIQYWISVEGWNVASIGTFEMTVTCAGDESFVYNMGTWTPSDPTGLTVPGDIVVAAGNAVMSGTTDCNSFTVRPGGGVTVPGGATVTTTNGFLLESVSTNYSSLILDGSIVGDLNYERHVNINGTGTTGSNDLVSAPLTGQAFSAFAAANPNLFSNTAGDLFLFGPYEKTAGEFLTYADTETATLDAGVGYRAATSDNGTLTFTGTAENGVVTNNIINTEGPSSTRPEWNLVGNPYPSYLNVQDFLTHDVGGVLNFQLFDAATAAIYGYDGSAINGWTVYNLATTTPSTLIAPGQGFFVSADATNDDLYDLQFTPAMRSTGTGDDFIAGRNAELVYVKLKASTVNNAFGTDIYFNNNASLGFDLGYDAALWGGSTPDFALYSNLAQDNIGDAMAIQAVSSTNLSDVVIPLGVHANQGESLTFSISDMTLPASVNVYLEDVVANTITLLNDSDYVITPSASLSGTGRFFLRTSEDALSTIDDNLDRLDIFTLRASNELVVSGQLLNSNTMLNLYDIQGRLVLTTKLDTALLQNRIDVSHINSGIYIVTVQNNSQEKTKKVIID